MVITSEEFVSVGVGSLIRIFLLVGVHTPNFHLGRNIYQSRNFYAACAFNT